MRRNEKFYSASIRRHDFLCVDYTETGWRDYVALAVGSLPSLDFRWCRGWNPGLWVRGVCDLRVMMWTLVKFILSLLTALFLALVGKYTREYFKGQ